MIITAVGAKARNVIATDSAQTSTDTYRQEKTMSKIDQSERSLNKLGAGLRELTEKELDQVAGGEGVSFNFTTVVVTYTPQK